MQKDMFSSLSIMGLRVSMLASKILLSIFIARYIGLDTLGIYGLIVSTAGMLQIVLRFGIFDTISREAVNQNFKELTLNIRNYGIGVLFCYMALIPITLLVGWYFDNQKLSIFILIIILIEHISYDVFILINNLQRPKLANIILSIQSASWIYLFITLAFFIPDLRNLQTMILFWVCAGIISITISLALAHNWPWASAFSQKLQRKWYRQYFKMSWKLYLSATMSSITMYTDRYFISIFLSLELVGVYVLYSQIINAISNLVGAGVLQVYRPRLILEYSKENGLTRFQKIFKKAFLSSQGWAIILSLLSAIIFPFIAKYIENPMVENYLPLLWLMIAALLFRIANDLFSLGAHSQKKDALNLKAGAMRLTLFLILTPIALNLWGIYGTVIIAFIVFITSVIYINKHLWIYTDNNKI
ncbi:MAG: oligosaccharide flippase family protein [Proteobacteria bacterium]|nr:oligosaccharide flippase family protein [Pseudomonadota bacterium]